MVHDTVFRCLQCAHERSVCIWGEYVCVYVCAVSRESEWCARPCVEGRKVVVFRVGANYRCELCWTHDEGADLGGGETARAP